MATPLHFGPSVGCFVCGLATCRAVLEAGVNVGSVVYAGDVIVAPEVRESHLVYVLRVEGGSDQLTFSSRGEATANAVAYARRAGVNVWLGNGAELGFVPLGCFREVRHSTAAENRATAAAAVQGRQGKQDQLDPQRRLRCR